VEITFSGSYDLFDIDFRRDQLISTRPSVSV